MPPQSTVSRNDAAHLLRRTGFGGSNAELTALTGETRETCVNAVMGFADGDAVPQGPDVGQPGWVQNEEQWEVHTQIIEWWISRMATLANPTGVPNPIPAVAAASPLQEKMTLFWHDHFACAQEKLFDIEAMWDQMRQFRRMGLGDFRDLVRMVAVHPAMLVYLDNESNVVGSEQENFARELMELYTCGVGEFTEPDVIAMARAWTGHNTVGWTGEFWDSTYVYRPGDHDQGQKTLFGMTDNWNGMVMAGGERDTIDELVLHSKQAATARFIARKLFKYFAHRSPSDTLVQNLADVFVAANMSIAALVRAILIHDQFWDAASRWAQVKSPTEYVVSIVKRAPLAVENMGLRWNMDAMGQTLLDPPNVAGWGSGTYWMSTAAAWGRGGTMRGYRWQASDAGFLASVENMTNHGTAAQTIFDAFGMEEVSSATRTEVEQWHSNAYDNARWSIKPQAFLLAALTPEFQMQ